MDSFHKRPRNDFNSYTDAGRGRERNFNRSPPERNFNRSPPERSFNRSPPERNFEYGNRGRGGGGQFRGGRGGGRGGFNGNGFGGGGGDRFHKTPGGDFHRMPASTENKTLVSQKLPPGTEGIPIELVGNFYRFLHSDVVVFHYDVDIVKILAPIRSSKGSSASPPSTDEGGCEGDALPSTTRESMSNERREGQERFIKKFADSIVAKFVESSKDAFRSMAYVFDGLKNMYTTQELVFEASADDDTKPLQLSRKFEMDIEGRPAHFRVVLKLVDRVSLGDAVCFYNGTTTKAIPERVISIFEIIFRFAISKSYTAYQRKFFDLTQVEHSPKVKLCDFVQGFINSVRPTEFGLALNVHLKTSCIIAQSYSKLLDLVCDILSVSERDLEQVDKRKLFEVNKLVRHLRVITKHSGRSVSYTIDAIVDKYPQSTHFQGKSGKMLIAEYFNTEYNMRVGAFPLVRCSGRNNVHLPLELCYVQASQFLNKNKFNQNIERELLFKSTHAPNVYFHKVAKIVQQIQESDSTGTLKSFGVELIPKAVRFEGRVLPAPKTVSTNQRDQFYKPAKPVEWSIFVFDTRNFNKRDLDSFEGQMQQKANELGLRLPKASHKDFVAIRNAEDIRNVFFNVREKTNSELVFVGIPMRHEAMPSADIYGIVKHFCDQKFGIISQCFKADILKRIPNGYFDTFLLKVNGKMHGINTALDPTALKTMLPFDTGRTMLVGVDVNHPGEQERILSSVAAAVGSCDSTFSYYNACIRVQLKERNEMVLQLDEMIIDLLGQYHKRNKCYPKNVIVFRDGVSEGQFDKVEDIEVPLIQRAFAHIGKEIALTVIVVQKRHHARFALSQQNTNGRKPTYNVPSGTVVDKAIMEPHLKAFYLNSHFSPLGTSKPTKYIILRDDLKMNSDQVQRLCFYACFNCIRTRNVIAIPTPVRYADLCAYRSKMHIEAQRAMDEGRGGGVGENFETDLVARLNERTKIHDELKRRLFYC